MKKASLEERISKPPEVAITEEGICLNIKREGQEYVIYRSPEKLVLRIIYPRNNLPETKKEYSIEVRINDLGKEYMNKIANKYLNEVKKGSIKKDPLLKEINMSKDLFHIVEGLIDQIEKVKEKEKEYLGELKIEELSEEDIRNLEEKKRLYLFSCTKAFDNSSRDKKVPYYTLTLGFPFAVKIEVSQRVFNEILPKIKKYLSCVYSRNS